MKIAMVYSGDIRDNGTPFYLRFAAEQVLGPTDWFTEDPSAPDPIPEGYDFYIHVDDGRDDFSVDKIPHPWGYWVVDSHLGPEVRIQKARQADIVWCAQKPFVDVLAKEGIKASWLPLACEPLLHCTREELAARENRPITEPDVDLAFVGHLNPERLEFLDALFRAFPNSWFAYGHFHEDMSRVYHRARLGVNHAVRDDLNMRFFELASMGVPQLADERMVGMEDLKFYPGEHYVPYASLDDAIFRGGEFLDGMHPVDSAGALTLVRSAHTYRHRLCTMIENIEQYLSSRGEPPCGPTSEASQP